MMSSVVIQNKIGFLYKILFPIYQFFQKFIERMLITGGHALEKRIGEAVADRTKHYLRMAHLVDYVNDWFAGHTPILLRSHPGHELRFVHIN